MRTSASPSLTSSAIPATRWSTFTALVSTAIRHGFDAIAAVRLAVRGRRKRGDWQQDLPWDVGMDRLAEQAYRPWILRP
jgi:hypothetical protein